MLRLMPLLLVLLLGACEGTYSHDQLVGAWRGVEWKEVNNNQLIVADFSFDFEEDRSYVGKYGNQEEKGTFWISGDYLHTKEEGKAEKKVEIAKLQNDSLVFRMNRAGVIEEMTLLKQ